MANISINNIKQFFAIPINAKWRWYANEASVSQGQYSVLAVFEIAFSLFIYYILLHWLALGSHITVLYLLVTPLLLLRSNASVALGKKRFREYLKQSEQIVTRTQKWTVFMVSVTIAGFMSYFLALYWLPANENWNFFLYALLLFTLILTTVISVLDSPGAGLEPMSTVVGFILGFFSIIFRFRLPDLRQKEKLSHLAVYLLILPFIFFENIGLWLRSIWVRLSSNLCYIFAGLRSLSTNIHEQMLSTDLMIPPQLIPEAIDIADDLHAGKLWCRFYQANKLLDKIVMGTLALFVYIPAMLYRFGIKSALWFWWPILLLPKWNEQNSTKIKHRHINRIKNPKTYAGIFVVILVVFWCLQSYMKFIEDVPQFLTNSVDNINWLIQHITNWPKPKLWMLTFSGTLIVLLCSVWKSVEYDNNSSEPNLQHYAERDLKVLHRLSTIVMLGVLFTGWAFLGANFREIDELLNLSFGDFFPEWFVNLTEYHPLMGQPKALCLSFLLFGLVVYFLTDKSIPKIEE